MGRIISAEYAAGFFDGEGSVGVNRTKYGTHLVVCLGQATTEVLLAIQDLYGGNLYDHTSRAGNDHWQLKWNGRHAYPFLQAIQPFAIVKRTQIDLALTTTPGIRLSEDIVEQLCALKRS